MCIAEGDGTKGNTSRLSHEVFHRNSHVFLQERTLDTMKLFIMILLDAAEYARMNHCEMEYDTFVKNLEDVMIHQKPQKSIAVWIIQVCRERGKANAVGARVSP